MEYLIEEHIIVARPPDSKKITSDQLQLDITDIIYMKIKDNLARLCVSISPGKKDKKWARNLEQDLQVIKKEQIQIIVCLLEWHELKQLHLLEYPRRAQEAGFIFYHLPIRDMDIPKKGELEVLIPILIKHLSNGQNILVHCRAGLGRAGTISACCLTHFNFNPEECISIVRNRRAGAIQTKAQEECIYNYYRYLHS